MLQPASLASPTKAFEFLLLIFNLKTSQQQKKDMIA